MSNTINDPTPGPWSYWQHPLHDSENGEPQFMVGPREFHTVADVRPGNCEEGLPEQTKANARLIASAPDLYEALKMARPFVAYAFDQGILGAEEAGRYLDSAMLAARQPQPSEP